MKPNYYTLAAFVAVSGTMIGAHFAHLDEVTKLCVGILAALATALAPQLASKDEAAK